MPKILISMSATVTAATAAKKTFAKGDRVVVRVKKNEWYIGTITRSGVKLFLTFDDGATAIVEASDFKHVKLLVKTKKLKRSLDDAEAAVLYTGDTTVKTRVKKSKTDEGDEGAGTVATPAKKGDVIRLTHNRGEIAPLMTLQVGVLKIVKTVFPNAIYQSKEGKGYTVTGPCILFENPWKKDPLKVSYTLKIVKDPMKIAALHVTVLYRKPDVFGNASPPKNSPWWALRNNHLNSKNVFDLTAFDVKAFTTFLETKKVEMEAFEREAAMIKVLPPVDVLGKLNAFVGKYFVTLFYPSVNGIDPYQNTGFASEWCSTPEKIAQMRAGIKRAGFKQVLKIDTTSAGLIDLLHGRRAPMKQWKLGKFLITEVEENKFDYEYILLYKD